MKTSHSLILLLAAVGSGALVLNMSAADTTVVQSDTTTEANPADAAANRQANESNADVKAKSDYRATTAVTAGNASGSSADATVEAINRRNGATGGTTSSAAPTADSLAPKNRLHRDHGDKRGNFGRSHIRRRLQHGFVS